MAAVVNVNGRISGEGEAVVSVFDHGFLYGEGVYETLRTYNQRPFLFERHTRRLRRSSQMIALHVPFTDEQLASRVRQTMDAAQLAGHEAHVRVMLTRGIGALTYDVSATPTPSLIVIVKPHVPPPAEAYAKGVRVAMVSVVRNHPAALNPSIKSNNLMNSALAMQEAHRRGGYEGVMRNHRGEIAECTMSNLFVVSKGVAMTPPLDAGLLAGITREYLFEVARDVGIEVRESVLRDPDLLGADEAFLTSTTNEVMPITRVDDHVIGSGQPGPVTAQLLASFRRVASQS